MTITETLNKFCMKRSLQGYSYFAQALAMLNCEPDPWELTMTKHVYPQVAKLNKTTKESVERNMRTAKNRAWYAMPPAMRSKYGWLQKMPTVNDLLFTMYIAMHTN